MCTMHVPDHLSALVDPYDDKEFSRRPRPGLGHQAGGLEIDGPRA